MPYSTGCSTPLSNFESGQNYKEVQDPAVIVSFPITNNAAEAGVSLLAWTTTPWTLPSNLALCVNPTEEYVKVAGMWLQNITQTKKLWFAVFMSSVHVCMSISHVYSHVYIYFTRSFCPVEFNICRSQWWFTKNH